MHVPNKPNTRGSPEAGDNHSAGSIKDLFSSENKQVPGQQECFWPDLSPRKCGEEGSNMESHVQAVLVGKAPAEELDSYDLGWLAGSDV